MPAPRLYLLDANALLHRAWHALPPLTNPEGVVVNAVYGCMLAVLKLLKQDQPDAFAACWDTEVATFRHEAYADYKAHREEQGPELYAQIPYIQEGFTTLGIPSIFLDGFEADDVIGTLATKACAAGWEVTIVTGDKDAYQLIRPGISVLSPKKGVSELVRIDEAALKELFGLTPDQFLEYKMLRGDPSDNIPGVKGIGEKGATELLQTYGTLNEVMKAAHDDQSKMAAGIRGKLLAGEKDLAHTRMLVTIHKDVPITWKPEVQIFDLQTPAVISFLERMGFRSLLNAGDKSKKTVVTRTVPGQAKTQENSSEVVSIPVYERLVLNEKTIHEWFQKLDHTQWLGLFLKGNPWQPALDDSDGVLLVHKLQCVRIPQSVLRNKEAKAVLQEIFHSFADKVVAFDAKTVMHLLKKMDLSLPAVAFDPQMAAFVLEADKGELALSELIENFLGRTIAETESEALAECLLPLTDLLQMQLKKEKLEEILERFETPLIPTLFAMEEAGILLDCAYLQQLQKKLQEQRQLLHKKMEQEVGEAFNPASPSQLAHILFETLKLPTQGVKRGKTGFSTASNELEKLRGQHPLIEQIEEHRELSKLLSTYIETLPTQVDAGQRVHTTFHQGGASTGRLSSTDPNLQNIPIRTELGRQIRRAFIAKPGFVLLSCDYAQIELRLAAAMAKDERMIAAFANNEDIHRTTAAAMWHVTPEEVTIDQRRAAKTVNFGVLYGQGAFGLAAGAGVSFAEAKDFIARYFEYYHRLKAYLEETKQFARQKGYVETLFGRRRPIPELFSPVAQLRAQAERMAVNMPIQGTEADILKLAMIELGKQLPHWSKEATMLLQVHDELVFEVPKEEVEMLAEKITQSMEKIVDVGVPLLVEAKQGLNWEEMTSI